MVSGQCVGLVFAWRNGGSSRVSIAGPGRQAQRGVLTPRNYSVHRAPKEER